MKKIFEKFECRGLLMFGLMLLCTIFGVTGVDAMHAEGGTIVYGEAVSLDYALENAPEVVKATIDREVVVIKPHLTPLYTLGAQHAKAMKDSKAMVVKYDEVELQGLTTKVNTAFSTAAQTQAEIDFVNNDLIAINETIIFKGINGYEADGTTLDGGWFIGYVKDKASSGKPIIVPVNGVSSGAVTNSIPALAKDTVALRGVRTGSEKQSRTAPLAVVPEQKENYLQKMIIETEETTWFKLAQELADVKWTKSDVTDYAIAEHKMTTETDTLLSKKRVLKIANKYNGNKQELTYFQEGIYWQAGKDIDLPKEAGKSDLISVMKQAFVGNQSSNTKIGLFGADVIEAINKIPDYDQIIYPGKPGQAFGLDVQKIIYGQYTLMIVHEPAFNDLLMADHGLIIDEAYLYKYTQGWRTIQLDNLKNGDSDSTSQVLMEAFCYILKNKNAHSRLKLVTV